MYRYRWNSSKKNDYVNPTVEIYALLEHQHKYSRFIRKMLLDINSTGVQFGVLDIKKLMAVVNLK